MNTAAWCVLIELRQETASLSTSFQVLMCVRVCLKLHVSEMESVMTPTEILNTRRTRNFGVPCNEDAIIAVVGRELWRSSRDIARKSGLPQPKALDVESDYQLGPHRH